MYYSQIIESEPNYITGYTDLAIILDAAGKAQQSMEMNAHVLQHLDPNNLYAHCGMGKWYDTSLKAKEACEEAKKILELADIVQRETCHNMECYKHTKFAREFATRTGIYLKQKWCER